MMQEQNSISKNLNVIHGNRWKGGITHNSSGGYIMVRKPNHHFADARGYVRQHRLVYEEYYKCCLLKHTVIHHKNEIVTDNRIQNLIAVVNNSIHKILYHNGIETSSRICDYCGGKTVMGWQEGVHPHYYWYRDRSDKTKWLCNKCHCKQRRGTL